MNLHSKWFSEPRTWPVPTEIGEVEEFRQARTNKNRSLKVSKMLKYNTDHGAVSE